MQVDRPFFSSLLIQQAKNLENHLIMLSSLPIDRSNEINFTNPYKKQKWEEKKRKQHKHTLYGQWAPEESAGLCFSDT